MNGRQAKKLRKLARTERSGEQGVVERGLVARSRKDDTLVQSPLSVRRMYQALKDRFNDLTQAIGIAKPRRERARKEPQADACFHNLHAPVAVIQKPLQFILDKCARFGDDGKAVEIDQRYFEAKYAADRGDGAKVKRIAAQFAAAA